VGTHTLIFLGGGDGWCHAFEALTPEAVRPGTALPVKLRTVWSFDCNPREYRRDDRGREIPYPSGDNRRGKKPPQVKAPSEIIATPVFFRNRVYVATGQDPDHGTTQPAFLHCIDATGAGDITASGKIWSYEMRRSLSTVSIADGLLYIADEAGHVRCLDADTGRVYWVHKFGGTTEQIWGSTLVADGKVFVGTRSGRLCVLRHGKQLEVLAENVLGGSCLTTPTAANGVLYVPASARLYAVRKK
jgi:hypothetical protein